MISHDRDFLDAWSARSCTSRAANASLRGQLFGGRSFPRRASGDPAIHVRQAATRGRRLARLRRTAFAPKHQGEAGPERLKALARMEQIAPAHVDTPFHFAFAPPTGMSDPCCNWKTRPSLRRKPHPAGPDSHLRPGSRIGLLGRNGAGKSTLVKLLAAEIANRPRNPASRRNLAIGYFAQHQLEQLRADESPLQHLVRQEPASREQELRDYLVASIFAATWSARPVDAFRAVRKRAWCSLCSSGSDQPPAPGRTDQPPRPGNA